MITAAAWAVWRFRPGRREAKRRPQRRAHRRVRAAVPDAGAEVRQRGTGNDTEMQAGESTEQWVLPRVVV